jgi:hypothetical protein
MTVLRDLFSRLLGTFMPDDTAAALVRVTASLEEVAALLKQSYEDRNAMVKALSTRDWKAERESHEQRMDAIRKEGEQKYTEQIEFRKAVFKLLESQLEVLQQIKMRLDGNPNLK